MSLSQKDQDFIRRVREGVSNQKGLGHLSSFAKEKTFIRGRPFNTKGYEFQEAILDDTNLDVCVGKGRQVGASELFLRLMLSFLGSVPDSSALMLLPFVKSALAMVKSRVDPVIQSSPALRSLLVPGSDSSSFKMLGTSQLHTGGSWSGDVISVAIDMRLVDEYDYHSPVGLSTSDATMDNSVFVDLRTGQRGVRRNFSTPLTPKRGVHALYMHSDQKQRLVYPACSRSHAFWPTHKNIVIDGWDGTVTDLTPSDILSLDSRGLLSTARLVCPSCRAVVPQSRLVPEHREWVPLQTSPHITRSGYWVTPFDLPFDPSGKPKRTPEWLVRSRMEFGSDLARFYNHRLGEPYADTTNSFLDAGIADNIVLSPLSPQEAQYSPVYGLVAGIDTGKPSYVVIGKPLPNNRMDVLYLLTVPVQGPNAEDLPEMLHALLKPYRLQKLVIDQYPFTPSVLKLQSLFPQGVVYACNYNLRDTSLQSVVVKEETQEISAHRTRVVSALAHSINSNHWKFPRLPLMMGESPADPGTFRNHASNITKINLDPDEGVLGEEWTSGGLPDHFVHAANYLNIAADLVRAQLFSTAYTPLPSPRPVSPGSARPENQPLPLHPNEIRHGEVLHSGSSPTSAVADHLLSSLMQR